MRVHGKSIHVVPRASTQGLDPAGGALTQLPNEVLELIIREVGMPPCRSIRPALTDCLYKPLELAFLNAFVLLDEADSISRCLAGVLIAPGLNRPLQPGLMFEWISRASRQGFKRP